MQEYNTRALHVALFERTHDTNTVDNTHMRLMRCDAMRCVHTKQNRFFSFHSFTSSLSPNWIETVNYVQLLLNTSLALNKCDEAHFFWCVNCSVAIILLRIDIDWMKWWFEPHFRVCFFVSLVTRQIPAQSRHRFLRKWIFIDSNTNNHSRNSIFFFQKISRVSNCLEHCTLFVDRFCTQIEKTKYDDTHLCFLVAKLHSTNNWTVVYGVRWIDSAS